MTDLNTVESTEQFEFEQFDFQRYWFTIKRRWIPAAIVLSIAPVASLAIAFSLKPVYEASGTLVIKPDQSSEIVGLDVQSADPQATSRQNTVYTQITIIKSVPLAQEVIASLDLRDDEGNLMSVKVFLENLQVTNIKRSDSIQISYKSQDSEKAKRIVDKVLEVYLNNNIVANRAETIAAGEFISQQLPKIESEVRKAEAEIRQFQEDNQLIAIEREAQSLVETLEGTDRRLSEAESRLVQAEAKSATLQNQLGMTAEQAIPLAVLSQERGVQDVLQEYQQVQIQLAKQRTVYDEAHPSINTLRRRESSLRELLQQRMIAAIGNRNINISDNNIPGSTLVDLEQKLVSELLQAEIERLSATEQFNLLQQYQLKQRDRANKLPALKEYYGQLERRLSAAQSTYTTLLARQQEIRVTENQNVGNARIISPALVSDNPVFPRKKLFLAAGCIVGAISGLATAFFLDLTDMTLKSVKEIKDLFPFTFLGVFPLYTDKKSKKNFFGSVSHDFSHVKNFDEDMIIFSRDLPHSPISGSYQALKTSIDFLGLGNCKTEKILVTSSAPGEGKSTISANLAAASAYLGKRVLLIDADMRKPTQHLKWEQANHSGLSNVLINEVSSSSVIKEVMPNLHLITSGTIPPNPLNLLSNSNFENLLSTLESEYDFIIIDAPPLASVPDSLLIGKYVDGRLLVARPYHLEYASGKLVKEKIAQANFKIDGLIINGVKIDLDPYTHNYSSYYSYYNHHSQQDSERSGLKAEKSKNKIKAKAS